MADEKRKNDYIESDIDQQIADISEFIDFNTFNKIINKLTDYAEIITEGKISGNINFNFRLNSAQTNKIIKILEDLQAITKIFNLALKGSKDLEMEYISNIYSDFENPENISSYINLKNILENRLTHQIQQYNMNMGKSNTTMAIPLNELRGHVKTYMDLSELDISISTKAQHGIIAASLHDAYTTLLNKAEFWNDKTYMKFYFNEDDPNRRKLLLLRKERRLMIKEIGLAVNETLEKFNVIQNNRLQSTRESHAEIFQPPESTRINRADTFTDRMMMTPFGKQYGSIIEKIISQIFDPEKKKIIHETPEETIKDRIIMIYQAYKIKSDISRYREEIIAVVGYLLMHDYGIKTFTEKFLFFDRKESFSKHFSDQNQEQIEQFLAQIFSFYFEEIFSSLFKIIKSMDMKKFACAFIIKRIYLREGENLTNFGFFFIRVIAKSGGIRSQ